MQSSRAALRIRATHDIGVLLGYGSDALVEDLQKALEDLKERQVRDEALPDQSVRQVVVLIALFIVLALSGVACLVACVALVLARRWMTQAAMEMLPWIAAYSLLLCLMTSLCTICFLHTLPLTGYRERLRAHEVSVLGARTKFELPEDRAVAEAALRKHIEAKPGDDRLCSALHKVTGCNKIKCPACAREFDWGDASYIKFGP